MSCSGNTERGGLLATAAAVVCVTVLSAGASGLSPSQQLREELKAVAASDSFYWAWDQPWLSYHYVSAGDTRYATGKDGKVVPAPIDRVEFDGRETRLTEAKCRIFMDELNRLTGTWRHDGYYATNRASTAAVIRRAWRDFRGVCVFTWHNDNPCCTNGFQRGPLRYVCREHPSVLGSIVRDEQWPCARETAVRGVFRQPFPSPRAWFLHELDGIAEFLSLLKDDDGRLIPVVIRYPHEMDGGWFWWGRRHDKPADFAAFCRLMADELRRRGAVGQVLFAYTPDRKWKNLGQVGVGEDDYLSWYPGDAYVDIVGFDDYSIGFGATAAECDARNTETLRKMRLLTQFAEAHGKVPVISEAGWAHVSWSRNPAQDDFYTRAYRLMTSEGVRMAVFATWRGNRAVPDTEKGVEDMIRFSKRPGVRLVRP